MTKRHTPRAAAIILVVAAVVGLCGSVALWRTTGDVEDFGATLADEVTPKATPTPLGRWGGQLDPLGKPKRENLSRSPALPRRVLVPALTVDAPVEPVGVDEQLLVDIPGDGDRIGWYQFGVRPGELTGSAVLIGHRDTEAEGPGALFELDALVAGDEITVVTRNEQLSYEVVARQSYPKQALPSRLFDRNGPHRLTLITCGGPYLADRGGYQDNLVVTAELIDRPDRADR